MRPSVTTLAVVTVGFQATVPLVGQDCFRGPNIVLTDAFSLAAVPAEGPRGDVASGAVGDVVGITFLLTSHLVNPGFVDLNLTVCHDPEVLELAGEPVYSDELIALVGIGGPLFFPVDQDAGLPGDHRGYGFIFFAGFDSGGYDARFPSDVPLPIMTAYYRVRGEPGDFGDVAFCDSTLERGNSRCNYTWIHINSGSNPRGTTYRPEVRIGATIAVEEGPATRPDPPPAPPQAQVYPELPSSEEVNFRVRVTGATAWPGARDVPIDVYVSADVEYTAVIVPVDFDERYLRLAEAEDHFLAGATVVSNADEHPGPGPEEGNVVILSGSFLSTRRLGAAGEEVHAATLYFDVLEKAAETSATALAVTPVTDRHGIEQSAFITVLHREGLGNPDAVVRSDVAPIAIAGGLLAIRSGPVTFVRADVTGDEHVDLSDAVSTLRYLFSSAGLARSCLDAADANDDGGVNLSDPVYTLNFLFRGGREIPEPFPARGEDPTSDRLDCLE